MSKWFEYSMHVEPDCFKTHKDKMTYLQDRQLYQLFGCPGVYALYAGNRLLYIGSSGKIRDRVLSHDWFWKSNINILTIKIRYTKKLGEWLMIEHRLIKRLGPYCNQSTINKKRICEGR